MEIKVPDLGVDSAEVSEIMVKVGDIIKVDDNIILLESDKASVEVPATQAGKITAITVQLGDNVSEGDVLLTLENADNTAATDNNNSATNQPTAQVPITAATNTTTTATEPNQLPAAQPVAPVASQQQYALPDLGVETADVSEWLVNVGDTVNAEQPLVLVESDKASVEVPAPVAGKVVALLVQAGDTVSNGQAFVVIETASIPPWQDTTTKSATESVPVAQTKAAQHESQTQPKTVATADSHLTEAQINAKHVDVYAGPAVRKLTRQLGVDIRDVVGSGTHGRVIKEDIFAYVKNKMQNTVASQNTASQLTTSANQALRSALPNLPDMSKIDIWGETERQDLSRLQKVSIPQLNYNTYLPQVTQFDLADITHTENLRSELKEELKKQGISLTILAFIMKVTAYALMQHPKFNSHLSDDNTQIIIRKSVNLGFAVAIEDGLTVPVIQNVQDKGIKQLAVEISELAKKARDKKLSAKELTGASFTISSQGNLGGTYFTPLVNWPQVAILGVSEATIQPRWNAASKSFEPRLMLPLSLSYDHRVINGADAAVFTRYIATLLADPRRVLL